MKPYAHLLVCLSPTLEYDFDIKTNNEIIFKITTLLLNFFNGAYFSLVDFNDVVSLVLWNSTATFKT